VTLRIEWFPQVKALVDAGSRGLARQFPGQVTAPPLKPAGTRRPAKWQSWPVSAQCRKLDHRSSF
jgi:hypothetical protein